MVQKPIRRGGDLYGGGSEAKGDAGSGFTQLLVYMCMSPFGFWTLTRDLLIGMVHAVWRGTMPDARLYPAVTAIYGTSQNQQ